MRKQTPEAEELQFWTLWGKNHNWSELNKMKRQKIMSQMKEQNKTPVINQAKWRRATFWKKISEKW